MTYSPTIFPRIAFGIHRDEDRLDFVGERAELVQRQRHGAERGWADIGTGRIAEIDQEPFAAEGCVGHAAAIRHRQCEMTTNLRKLLRRIRLGCTIHHNRYGLTRDGKVLTANDDDEAAQTRSYSNMAGTPSPRKRRAARSAAARRGRQLSLLRASELGGKTRMIAIMPSVLMLEDVAVVDESPMSTPRKSKRNVTLG